MKIMVNATNLHSGGGVQVATSFVIEALGSGSLAKSGKYNNIDFFVSSEVHENILSISRDVANLSNYHVENTYALSACRSRLYKAAKSYNVIFTIFGPDYLLGLNSKKITGFAQPWIIYDEGYKLLSYWAKKKTKLKYWVQKKIFNTSDALIVELDHVRKRLILMGVCNEFNIYVVHNCLSSLYLNPESWQKLAIGLRQSSNFRIGFLGRDYPHKNTAIIPRVKAILKETFGLDVDFYVTFTDEEWASKPVEFKDSITNAGPLTVAQCPNYYKGMDAIIFPSILECFSATPLEALAMEKPLFSSDRGFVSDVCGDYAYYFDPFDAHAAAAKIANYIENYWEKDQVKLKAAREHVISFSSPKARAEQYLNIISTIANR